MDQELMRFNNEQFGDVRVIERDGNSWYVAADVCRALEISNPTVALGRLDEDERSKIKLGRQGEANVVNESGLYALILGSRKPTAKAFKRWIAHDVIPSVRNRRACMTSVAIEQIIANPDYSIQLLYALKAEREKNKLLQPKADYFDALVERNTLAGIRETAKELRIRQKTFVDYLLEHGYAYRDSKDNLQPYAAHVEAGLFVVNEHKCDQNSWSATPFLITPKGRETFKLLMSIRQNIAKGETI